jgi:hypothetical protein
MNRQTVLESTRFYKNCYSGYNLLQTVTKSVVSGYKAALQEVSVPLPDEFAIFKCDFDDYLLNYLKPIINHNSKLLNRIP